MTQRFIPFRKTDIVQMSKVHIEPKQHHSFEQLCRLLSSVLHFEYHTLLERLKDNYAPFDPNSDTQLVLNLTESQKQSCQQAFAIDFATILNAANFEKITEQDLTDALNEESLFKIRLAVSFEDFAEVVFYRRGESIKNETLLTWWGLKKETIEFTHYDRVAVFIRFKNEAYFEQKGKKPFGFEPGSTIVKLFQNVPKADLEMLFPNSEVRMRPIDKVVIGASAAIGGIVVLVTKLGASLLLLAALLAYWLGLRAEEVEITKQHLLTFAIGIGVFASFIFKEWTKFKNRKIKFMKALSDNLYFKSLDNNAGVFHTLVDCAEEEECKEAILAYAFLLKHSEGLTLTQLDTEIEQWLADNYHCELDFEIGDAMDKLIKFNLVESKGAHYYAKSIEDAKVILDERWDNYFDYAN